MPQPALSRRSETNAIAAAWRDWRERRPAAQPGLSWTIAWRSLLHERSRFIVTLTGIAFSVVLMTIQWGLLIGCADTASGLVDHAQADFWVVSRGTSNVDQTLTLPGRWRYRALAVPGVVAVDKFIVRFADWRRPDGRNEFVNVVGLDLDGNLGRPWNIVSGSIDDLRKPEAVIIDRLYAEKLGVRALGDTVEIGGIRAQIVGFTEGIRAFTQSPYVFTSFKNALRFVNFRDDQTNYLLIRTDLSVDRGKIQDELRNTLSIADVLSSSEFSFMTAKYWLLTTGAGIALLAGVALGAIVGIVVVAQTLYAATVEHLAEYATILAIGAPNRYLNRIVLNQALISAAFGFALGIAITAGAVAVASHSSVALYLSWRLAVVIWLITLAMCGAASLVAVRKIKIINPTTVFR